MKENELADLPHITVGQVYSLHAFFLFKLSQHLRGAHLHQFDVTHFVSLSNFYTAE